MIWPHVCNVTTVVTVHAVMEPRIVVKGQVFCFEVRKCIAQRARYVEFLGAHTKRRCGRVVYVRQYVCFYLEIKRRRGEGEHSTENFEETFENKVYIFNSKIIKTGKLERGLDLGA